MSEFCISKKERVISVIIIIIIVLFTVISCFGCFEVSETEVIGDMILGEHVVHTKPSSNSFPLILILSIIQVFLLRTKKRKHALLSLLVAFFSFFVTASHVFVYNLFEKVFTNIGQCTPQHNITWLGYVAILVAIFNIVMQLYSLSRKKDGSEQ